MRYIKIYVALALLALCGVGCKPTEKNYRQAYEAAKSKQQRAVDGMEVAGPLQSDDSFSLRRVGNDSLWIGHRRYKLESAFRGTEMAPADVPYGVALSLFSMPANARAMAERLSAEGATTTTATDGRGNWIVVGCPASDLPGAVTRLKDFENIHPRYVYVGLPGPAIVQIYR